MEHILYFMATRCVPRVAMKYKIYSMARVGSTNFKITKITGYAKEIDVVDESDEEIQNVLQEKDAQNTKKSTKFAIQAFRAFGDLQTAEESVENLDKILARIFGNYFSYFA